MMDQSKYSKRKQKKCKTLIQLQKMDDSGNSSHESTSNTSQAPVDLMTSRELQYDLKARISSVRRMLKDTVRIDNFKEAILHNKHLFKNKCVLNINCGIGIYALLAAKAEAAKVYAVDDSNVIYYTRQIIKANGYSETIEVIKGKISEIELPVSEVDIIVSDWMGNALFYESSCYDVIFARDKWLKKPGGLIFPDEAKLFIVAFEDGLIKNRNIEWWRRVYGFDMSCLREVALKEPRVHNIKPEQVLSKQFPIKTLNLNTATLEDLKVRSKFILPIINPGRIDGIGLYFHIYFTKAHIPFGFSTDPWSLATDWMQTKFFFDEFFIVSKGSVYYGGIEFHPTISLSNFHDMIVNLEMFKGEPTAIEEEIQMTWHFKVNAADTDNSESSGANKVSSSNNNNANLSKTNIENISTENGTKNLSKMNLDCDSKAKCLVKSEIRDNCKTELSIVVKKPNNSIKNQTFTQSTTTDLNTDEVIKNSSNNSNTLTKLDGKQSKSNRNTFLKKNSKAHNKTSTHISAAYQSNNTLNTTVTIGDCNYPCRKIRNNKNKCKFTKKVNYQNQNNQF